MFHKHTFPILRTEYHAAAPRHRRRCVRASELLVLSTNSIWRAEFVGSYMRIAGRQPHRHRHAMARLLKQTNH